MSVSNSPIVCLKPRVHPGERTQLLIAGILLGVFAFLWVGISTLALYAALFGAAEPAEAGAIAAIVMFFACGVGLLVWGCLLWRRVRLDDRRRTRLAKANVRIPVQRFRVVTESVTHKKHWRSEYRIAALFTGYDGRDYEAWSDRYAEDPTRKLDLRRLRVLLDQGEVEMSLVAEDTVDPAARATRR